MDIIIHNLHSYAYMHNIFILDFLVRGQSVTVSIFD